MHLTRPLVAAALVSVAIALPAGATHGPASSAPRATTYTTSSLQLGPLRQNPRVGIAPGVMFGRDNATSVAVAGKSYWFFGDTFIAAPLSAINNSAAVTSDLNGIDGITVTSSNVKTDDAAGAPVALIEKNASELAFEAKHREGGSCAGSSDSYCGSQFAHWPGSAVYDAARHRVIILTTKLCRFGLRSCTSGFTGTILGGGITTLDVTTGKVKRLSIKHQERHFAPEGRDPSLLFSTSDFFAATAWGEGGYLYSAYGCDPYTFTCKLARVPLGSVDDRAAWRFFSGAAGARAYWSTSDSGSPRVLSTGAAGGTVQWVPALKSYLAIYTVPYASDVVYQLAPHAWGPWGPAQRLFATLAPKGEVPNYAAFAHPEYATDGGLTQYVTYYHSGYGELQLVKVRFCPSGTALCT